MSTQVDHSDPGATATPSEVWVLKAVFGSSALAFVIFWVMMLMDVPEQSRQAGVKRCQAVQVEIEQSLRELCALEGEEFSTVLQRHGRGATIGPLFELLKKRELIPDPPPHTDECRSWKDYTIVDAQNPRLTAVSCRIHGGRVNPERLKQEGRR